MSHWQWFTYIEGDDMPRIRTTGTAIALALMFPLLPSLSASAAVA